MGYCQRCALVSNTDEGGAVSSDRLCTLYTLHQSLPTSDPEFYDPFTEALTLGANGPRAMSNLLRPFGIPRTAYDLSWSEINRLAPDSGREPMPPQLGAAIQTRQGVRRLLPDELDKGLGVPAEWGDRTAYPDSLLNHLLGIHIGRLLAEISAPCSKQAQKDHRHR
jgi:hypothetical protein